MAKIYQFPGRGSPALSKPTPADGFVRMDRVLMAVQYHMLVTKNLEAARGLMLLANNGVLTGEFKAFIPGGMAALVGQANMEEMLKELFSLSE